MQACRWLSLRQSCKRSAPRFIQHVLQYHYSRPQRSMKRLKNNAFAGNTGHVDNELDLTGLAPTLPLHGSVCSRNMKSDVRIRKELYAISHCQVVQTVMKRTSLFISVSAVSSTLVACQWISNIVPVTFLPSMVSSRTTVTVFGLPRGTLRVVGTTTITAHTGSLVHACTSARIGLRATPSLSLFKAVSS